MTACAAPSGAALGPTDSGVGATPATASQQTDPVVASPSVLPTPVALPRPRQEPGTLALDALSCDGGVVLEWSPSVEVAFHHYTGLRSPTSDVSPVYPPLSPAVDWGGAYATDRFVVSAVDATLVPSDDTWFYRVMSYDADGRVLEASAVVAAEVRPVASLGALTVEPGAGQVTISWTPYRGPSACFTEYRVMYGAQGPPATLLATVSSRESASLETDVLADSAATHVVRVDAVGATPLGSFVVARSEVTTVKP